MLFRIVFSWLFAITLIQESITQETVEVNNFAIHLCDSYQTSKLAALIGDIEDSIENVINDLALGTSSKHGYTTFFKQDANRAEISTVYRKIQMGANILVQNGIASLRRPTFICSNNQPGTNGLYEMCQENPTAPVMRFRNSNLIPICPVFWTARQKPNRKYCPVVVNNTLTPNNDILLLNQLSVLVWSLVYLYHAAAKDTGIIDGGIATASNLNAAESLLSPQNYAFYYACIHARCTEFPNMGKPHDDFRRLFEAPYNSTDLLGTAANSTNLLEVSNNYNSSSLTTITNLNATKAFFLEIPLVPIPSTLDSTAQDDCNDKTLAPNNTVCCDQESGLWVPAQVVRDGPLASMANPACPANTGGTGGVGAGSGIINTSDRGKVNANSGLL